MLAHLYIDFLFHTRYCIPFFGRVRPFCLYPFIILRPCWRIYIDYFLTNLYKVPFLGRVRQVPCFLLHHIIPFFGRAGTFSIDFFLLHRFCAYFPALLDHFSRFRLETSTHTETQLPFFDLTPKGTGFSVTFFHSTENPVLLPDSAKFPDSGNLGKKSIYRPLIAANYFENPRPNEGPIRKMFCTSPHETIIFFPDFAHHEFYRFFLFEALRQKTKKGEISGWILEFNSSLNSSPNAFYPFQYREFRVFRGTSRNLKTFFGRLRKWMYDFGRFCVRYGRKNILAETAQKRVYVTLKTPSYENFISDQTRNCGKKSRPVPLFFFFKIRGCETFF